MIAGKKYVAVGVDVWSSGITLFAMMCGYLPFDHQETSMLYKKILSGIFQMPKFLSEEGKDFISRILEKNPEKRMKIDEMY